MLVQFTPWRTHSLKRTIPSQRLNNSATRIQGKRKTKASEGQDEADEAGLGYLHAGKEVVSLCEMNSSKNNASRSSSTFQPILCLTSSHSVTLLGNENESKSNRVSYNVGASSRNDEADYSHPSLDTSDDEDEHDNDELPTPQGQISQSLVKFSDPWCARPGDKNSFISSHNSVKESYPDIPAVYNDNLRVMAALQNQNRRIRIWNVKNNSNNKTSNNDEWDIDDAENDSSTGICRLDLPDVAMSIIIIERKSKSFAVVGTLRNMNVFFIPVTISIIGGKRSLRIGNISITASAMSGKLKLAKKKKKRKKERTKEEVIPSITGGSGHDDTNEILETHILTCTLCNKLGSENEVAVVTERGRKGRGQITVRRYALPKSFANHEEEEKEATLKLVNEMTTHLEGQQATDTNPTRGKRKRNEGKHGHRRSIYLCGAYILSRREGSACIIARHEHQSATTGDTSENEINADSSCLYFCHFLSVRGNCLIERDPFRVDPKMAVYCNQMRHPKPTASTTELQFSIVPLSSQYLAIATSSLNKSSSTGHTRLDIVDMRYGSNKMGGVVVRTFAPIKEIFHDVGYVNVRDILLKVVATDCSTGSIAIILSVSTRLANGDVYRQVSIAHSNLAPTISNSSDVSLGKYTLAKSLASCLNSRYEEIGRVSSQAVECSLSSRSLISTLHLHRPKNDGTCSRFSKSDFHARRMLAYTLDGNFTPSDQEVQWGLSILFDDSISDLLHAEDKIENSNKPEPKPECMINGDVDELETAPMRKNGLKNSHLNGFYALKNALLNGDVRDGSFKDLWNVTSSNVISERTSGMLVEQQSKAKLATIGHFKSLPATFFAGACRAALRIMVQIPSIHRSASKDATQVLTKCVSSGRLSIMDLNDLCEVARRDMGVIDHAVEPVSFVSHMIRVEAVDVLHCAMVCCGDLTERDLVVTLRFIICQVRFIDLFKFYAASFNNRSHGICKYKHAKQAIEELGARDKMLVSTEKLAKEYANIFEKEKKHRAALSVNTKCGHKTLHENGQMKINGKNFLLNSAHNVEKKNQASLAFLKRKILSSSAIYWCQLIVSHCPLNEALLTSAMVSEFNWYCSDKDREGIDHANPDAKLILTAFAIFLKHIMANRCSSRSDALSTFQKANGASLGSVVQWMSSIIDANYVSMLRSPEAPMHDSWNVIWSNTMVSLIAVVKSVVRSIEQGDHLKNWLELVSNGSNISDVFPLKSCVDLHDRSVRMEGTVPSPSSSGIPSYCIERLTF